MTMIQEALDREWNAQSEQNPFAEAMAEAMPEAESPPAERMAPGDESASPFAEAIGEAMPQSESDRLLAQAFAELRDEAFDEAVAFLTEETEQTVADRFTDESPSSAAERERYADAQLSPVRFEAGQYLESLEQALAGQDLESMGEEQLSEALDRLDPQTGEMTPAGEEFVSAIVRKAKKVVKFVANTAKTVGKVAGTLLGPVLQRLKALINPLLKRVLSMAIGRLPAALQPAARTLAAKITSEAFDSEGTYEASSPTNLVDVESLAESFDAALAEAITGEATGGYSGEYEEPEYESESGEDGRALEHLAQARGVLIDRIRSADDNEDLAPAVEQFAPVLLGALRVGINLVGRSKVVRFLAGYLGKLISRWVGPQLSGPLSNAIVDTGMRLVALEAEDGTRESRADEAAPVALASVVEDTVRRLAEQEDYVFENEDLLQLAASDAFGEAVATHFPQNLVRPPLRQAPSVGGTFVARRPRSVRTYRKYNRTPEVEITAQIADALPTFGGSTVGAVLRAAGATFPFRARMHIYQSAAGTTFPRMIRTDRGNGARGAAASWRVHPLTPEAAGLLLREPKLGVATAPAFLRSRHRIAVGQRFYLLEPVNAAGALAMPPAATRAAASRLAPSRAWIVVNLRRARITVGFYLSEADTQTVADGIRQGRGPVLLQALTRAYRAMQQRTASAPAGHVRIVQEDSEDHEDEAAKARVSMPPAVAAVLRRRIDAWVLPALATWARANGEAFARAAGHPDAGVTVRVRLGAVPGMDLLAQAGQGAARATPAAIENALRGTPTVAITVTPGRGRK
ncbi:hypothetical protein [Lysobacter auxotrophicus]|uniref:Uncharacterized protein n=1 Tax=Lysobacter auxotrophicus TaxID=2992573 RepID=A0ABM8DDU0_9GAMM|nr:hypothetical protein [Lysobacter auxotrophicus]BDU16742.1 hypothetical protein LA521A_19430 [Lysobacter auxotrophicus]